MTTNVMDMVLAATRDSEPLRAAASVRGDGGRGLALGPADLRPLTREEVQGLERLGNTADDWSQVRVTDGFDWRRVRQSQFHGQVALGRFTGTARLAEGIELPTGISNSTVIDCTIGHEAMVRDVRLLAKTVVAGGAIVYDCGTVACTGPTTFGNGQILPLGPETGEREVAVYAEISVPVAAALTRGATRRSELGRYQQCIEAYRDQVRCDRVILERGAVVRGTGKVLNTYVGPHAVVDGATLVQDSTILSSAEEPAHVLSGACVCGSLLQWGSRVEGGAQVERTVLTEYASVERHGKVVSSILGPDTAVAQGEVTSSLLGPLVGFHHQAMLIAALWPEGRGNVSNGACVGANHTSRAPDQEAHLGEGTFLGLGVNVKYPLDLSRAPYCVVACGVNLPPQRVVFPFALLNVASAQWANVPAFYNEITPGWALSENLYALKRTEWKHRSRCRARRSTFAFDIFRPDTVEMMREAGRLLESVSVVRDVYTDRQLDGLGKNYLTEKNRQKALWVYQSFIRLYALLGLFEQASAADQEGRGADVPKLLETASHDARWEHQRRLLKQELLVWDVAAGLGELPDLLEEVARYVERSKDRDDARGRKVIADYADVHVAAGHDPIILRTWAETRRIQEEVKRLLARLDGHPASDPECDLCVPVGVSLGQ